VVQKARISKFRLFTRYPAVEAKLAEPTAIAKVHVEKTRAHFRLFQAKHKIRTAKLRSRNPALSKATSWANLVSAAPWITVF